MNFCTRCGSLYSQPGTCNCYAHGQPHTAPTQPYVPVWPKPYAEPVPYREPTTGDPFPSPYDTTCGGTMTTTGGPPIWVTAAPTDAPWAVYTGGANA